MVLKQGPNKHIIGCHKIQNFQFVVGELQEDFLKAKQIECWYQKAYLSWCVKDHPTQNFEFMFINHNVKKTFKW